MPLTLYVDRREWQRHLSAVFEAEPELVPVAKGNGYGFTVPELARAATALGVDQLAVGDADDAATVLALFPGEVLILGSSPEDAQPELPADRTLHTAASVEAVRRLAGRRLVVDCCSSLLRQGISPHELPAVRTALGGQSAEAFSIHLPMNRPARTDLAGETASWVRALTAEGLAVPTMYVSHLTRPEIAGLERSFPATRFRPRIGTRLWLGRPAAIQAYTTVLDSFPVRRGERVGYRQRRFRQGGWVVVVSGGTEQGVGLEAPRTMYGVLPRMKELLRSGLAAANRTRSPFSWQGHRQWFAEPPHMLVSMLFLLRGEEPPTPGMELPADLRHTTTRFDRVVMR